MTLFFLNGTILIILGKWIPCKLYFFESYKGNVAKNCIVYEIQIFDN